MPRYRREHVPGGTFFFTVNLLERRRRLLVDHVDDLRASFRAARHAQPFKVIAIVILPDHRHCLWRLPEGDGDNAGRWARIKSGFCRRLPPVEDRSEVRVARRERGIWQRGSGSIHFATKRIFAVMSITSTSIPSSMDVWLRSATGRIPSLRPSWNVAAGLGG